jgi:hypothetical protein
VKKIILLIIISITFVFGQFNTDSSEYNFSYKNGKKIGSIIYSPKYQRQLSKSYYISEDSSYKGNVPVYKFDRGLRQGKVLKEKDYYVKKDSDDHIQDSLWYEYHFNVYSKYSNGQIKEEGSFEKRYGGYQKGLDKAIGASVSILLLPLDILDGELGHDLDREDYLFKDGKWQGWYDSGELRYSATHVSGQLHGQVDEYFKNGQKKSGGEYSYNRKVGKHAEWYKSGWIKEYSVDGVVKRSHKESEQAFFWNSKNDKNYQAAYKLANDMYSEKISSISKKTNLQPLKVTEKSNPISSEKSYQNFVFGADYTIISVETYYTTSTDWYTINQKAESIYRSFGYYPTEGWYRDRVEDYTYQYENEREIEEENTVEYQLECSNGVCNLLQI